MAILGCCLEVFRSNIRAINAPLTVRLLTAKLNDDLHDQIV